MHNLTRRGFIGAAASAALTAGCKSKFGAIKRHRSDFGGISIGAITYSFSKMPHFPKDCTRNFILDAGLGSVEMMDYDFEQDLGIVPFRNKRPKFLTKENKAAISMWRETADMKPIEEFRARYADNGISMHIVKFGDIGFPWMYSWKEAEYMFKATRALGARVITREVPKPEDWAAFKATAQKLVPLMNEYDVDIAFHNHAQISANTYDGALLDYSDHFKINFDIGNYVAANSDDPLEFIKKYSSRIASIHIKDRKRNDGPEMPFGKGDTDLPALFSLLKQEQLDIPCDIEMEYAIAENSDAVKETARSVEYCKRFLV